MGINQAFSSWIRGAQSFATTTLRSAQAYQAALQTQTLTAVSAAQRAALQPIQQALQPRPSPRSPAAHTTRTTTSVDLIGGAARTVQGGVRAAEQAARQIARAHAPIVQGVQRDVVRAAQAAPGAVRSVPAAAQQAARQISAAHAPIVQGVRRDVGAVTRPVGAAGAPQQTARSQAATSSAAVARHNQEVARYQASPAHAAIPRFQQRYDEAVRRYEHDPQVQTYKSKLAAYNAQLSAHGRAGDRGRGRQETAERLQSMYGELDRMRGAIDARKRQELGEIRMLGANLQMLSVPMQAEFARLQAQERALAPATPRAASSPTSTPSAVQQFAAAHAPIIEGLQRDAARVWSAVPAPIRDAAAVANLRKREAQAELTRHAGPAAPFEQGWTHPLYQWGQDVNRDYQAFADQAYPLWSRTQPLHAIPEIKRFQRGLVRAPGSLIEGLTFIPPAAERGGQLLWKEPHKLPDTVAKFAGQQIEGMGAAYERDPYDFAGEMIGTAALTYGLGAVARPALKVRGPGNAAPSPRAAAGSTGGRFRALEFGFQTKLIRKTAPEAKTPFRLSEWQASRQKYARPPPAAMRPARTTPARQAQIPVESGTGTSGGVSRQMAGYGAPYLGYGGPAARPTTTPADQAVEMLTQTQMAPQRGGIRPQRLAHPGASSQDLKAVQGQVSRQDAILNLGQVQVSPVLDQPLDLVQMTRTPSPTRVRTSPPPHGGPIIGTFPSPLPPKTSARGKDKKKKEEEERRRRRKKGELDHWELGPAPGIDEMGMLVFGSRAARQRGSYLDFGPHSVGAVGRGVGPKTSSSKKVAHAQNTKETTRKPTKTNRRTKNSKR